MIRNVAKPVLCGHWCIYIAKKYQSSHWGADEVPTVTDYRAGHSYVTALLRVYNDIVTTVGIGNGSFLVLLDFKPNL